MKKYIKPITKVVEVSNEELLAGSFGNANDTQGFSGRAGGFSKGADDDWDEEDF